MQPVEPGGKSEGLPGYMWDLTESVKLLPLRVELEGKGVRFYQLHVGPNQGSRFDQLHEGPDERFKF
jgi:hypothetical protein